MSMDHLRIFEQTDPEYIRLLVAADFLALFHPDTDFRVQDTYFDYGQDWKYTTIIASPKSGGYGYQLLNPVEQKDLCYGHEDAYRNVLRAVSTRIR